MSIGFESLRLRHITLILLRYLRLQGKARHPEG
jgi:hypothetical protein